MKYIKTNYKTIITFILFFVLSAFFSICGKDLIYVNLKTINFNYLIELSKGNILPTLLLLISTKYKIIRVLIVSALLTYLFNLIKNIIFKNNNNLFYLGIVLFLLLDRTLIKTSVISIYGFYNYTLTSIGLLKLIEFYSKDNFRKIDDYKLVLYGFILSIINPIVSILSFITGLFKIIIYKMWKTSSKNVLDFFIGSTLGLALTIFSLSKIGYIVIPNIFDIFVEEVIPFVNNMNKYLIVLPLFLSIILSFKVVYKGESKEIETLVISNILLLLCTIFRLQNLDYHLVYVYYFLYHIVLLFIIFKLSKSNLCKHRFCIYFIFKYIYLLLISINFNKGLLIFISLIDILIVLEFINMIIKPNYLDKIFLVISVIFVLAYIKIYNVSYIKFNEMNKYIKYHLECNYKNILVPSKYNQNFINNLLPSTDTEKQNYITYYNIDTDINFNITFDE